MKIPRKIGVMMMTNCKKCGFWVACDDCSKVYAEIDRKVNQYPIEIEEDDEGE